MKIDEFYKRYFTIRKCVSCGEFLPYEERDAVYCKECRLRWSIEKTKDCKKCMQAAVDCTCQPKELSEAGALCLRKLVFYDKMPRSLSPQMRTIYRLKRKPHRRAELYVARELAPQISSELSVLGLENSPQSVIVTGVPRGGVSRRKYGMDQSARLVKAIGECMGIDTAWLFYRTHILTGEQKSLNKRERFKNAKKYIALREDVSVNGKYVILFDDIVTSGASMTACVKLLYKAGARGVFTFCIAQN